MPDCDAQPTQHPPKRATPKRAPKRAMQPFIPLSTLHPGQSALVHQVVGHANQVRRLEEMGIRSGVKVEVVRKGSPCIVRLGGDPQKKAQAGSKLCFRDGELLQVMVSV